jgi:hypothetical protein
MAHSNPSTADPTTPLSQDHLHALAPLLGLLGQLAQHLLDFPKQGIDPQATAAFETTLQDLLRQLGLEAVAHLFNSLEPQDKHDMPKEIKLNGTRYRVRPKTCWTVSCLFGQFKLRHFLYEPREHGERCLHPLPDLLGIVASCASPALAQKTGRLVAQHSQRAALGLLFEEHAVPWCVDRLRRVAGCVAEALSQQRQAVQADRLVGWLEQTSLQKGGHLPVLVAGRDAVKLRIRGVGHQEAVVATVSVYDRRGQRLGTVYLGRMPEYQEATLTAQLTGLLVEVLTRWPCRRLRLAYLTDCGWQPQCYYRSVLRKMADPAHPGQRLRWEWVVDYYHACLYVSLMAEGLFGPGQQARAWAARMRRLLKQPDGARRVLQSASYHRNQDWPIGERAEKFWEGYGYLAKYGRQMGYARCLRLGIPLGSGVTEAGCKVVVTQRLKQSGMGWGGRQNQEEPFGQVVLDLRVLVLSGVYEEAFQRHLGEIKSVLGRSYEACRRAVARKAA